MQQPSYFPYTLFTYSINTLAQKDKVLFYYALKGRDGDGGILANKNIIHVGRTVVLVPQAMETEFAVFLKHWKAKFQRKQIFLEKPVV